MNLEGKTALITGVSRGIGQGLVARFTECGVRVAGCARHAKGGATDCAFFERLDLTDTARIAPFVERAWNAMGGIDLVINNAGILGPVEPQRALTADELRHVLEVNVVAPVVVGQAYLRLLEADQAHGTLINVSSGAAKSGYAGWSAYCASKSALDRLSECLHLEETPQLRTFAIAPGVIDTDMQATLRATDEAKFPMKEKFMNLLRDDAFSSTKHVADGLLDVAFGGADNNEVVLRLPPEDKSA